MNTDDLRNLADDPDLIEGIYNYCDRWCKRCAYTARCMNYAIGQMQFGDLAEQELPDKAFWQRMEELFQLTAEMIREDLLAQGIDLEQALAEADDSQIPRISDEDWAQPLVQRAEAYVELADAWLAEAGEAFHAKGEELSTLVQLNVGGDAPASEVAALQDAVEVIRWYQHQIAVKLLRALGSRRDEANDPELWAEFGRDSDGSAKVALIGLDRSVGAWSVLLRAFPQRELETLRLLAHLDRLRRDAEQEFPDARAFVRPGLDTPNLDMG